MKREHYVYILPVALLGIGLLYVTDLRMGIGNDLDVTSGVIETLEEGEFLISSPQMRMYFKGSEGNEASLLFTYLGETEEIVPLASGVERRQIGLKLHAHDTCNTLYVMWHIDESEEIVVSAKHNPGKDTHEECGANGYTDLSPREYSEPSPIEEGEVRLLGAVLEGTWLTVRVDGAAVWEGEVPEELLAPDGPAGMRSDNGVFTVTPDWR